MKLKEFKNALYRSPTGFYSSYYYAFEEIMTYLESIKYDMDYYVYKIKLQQLDRCSYVDEHKLIYNDMINKYEYDQCCPSCHEIAGIDCVMHGDYTHETGMAGGFDGIDIYKVKTVKYEVGAYKRIFGKEEKQEKSIKENILDDFDLEFKKDILERLIKIERTINK